MEHDKYGRDESCPAPTEWLQLPEVTLKLLREGKKKSFNLHKNGDVRRVDSDVKNLGLLGTFGNSQDLYCVNDRHGVHWQNLKLSNGNSFKFRADLAHTAGPGLWRASLSVL